MGQDNRTVRPPGVYRSFDKYVPIQKSIMQSALKMLKPGGYIVYSTCTFSKEEDEEIIQYEGMDDE